MKSPFLVYRMIHIDNLEYILQQGRAVCPNHQDADPHYKQIGNNDIITRRSQKLIPGFGSKTFRDSIAFYFGYPSIMLYNIKTGWGVPELPQSDIVYLSYDISAIPVHGYRYFYTDGQANKIPITRVFYDLSDIGEVDLDIAHTRDFDQSATAKNPDLKRRKHAEFHIFDYIVLDHLYEIVVYSDNQLSVVNSLITSYQRGITAKVDQNYYY